MTTPLCTHEVRAPEFYTTAQVLCPRCRASHRLNAPPMLIMASAAMPTTCPDCGLAILVNMSMGDPVVFEGFTDNDAMVARLVTMGDAVPPPKPEKKWWKFW